MNFLFLTLLDPLCGHNFSRPKLLISMSCTPPATHSLSFPFFHVLPICSELVMRTGQMDIVWCISFSPSSAGILTETLLTFRTFCQALSLIRFIVLCGCWGNSRLFTTKVKINNSRNGNFCGGNQVVLWISWCFSSPPNTQLVAGPLLIFTLEKQYRYRIVGNKLKDRNPT